MIRAFFFENKWQVFLATTKSLFRHYDSTRFPTTEVSDYHYDVNYFFRSFRQKLRYTLALSGGENMGDLYKYWHHHHLSQSYWYNMDFYWLDEQWVPYSDERSNYGTAHKNFFQYTSITPHRIHPINIHYKPEREAHRYASELPSSTGIQYDPTMHLIDSEKTLRGFHSPFYCAIIELDKNGYISSIPFDTPLVFTNDKYYATKDRRTQLPHITATLELLRNIPRLIVLTIGLDRVHIVRDLYYGRNAHHPMLHLLRHHPNVHIFVDNKIMERTVYPDREGIGYYFPYDHFEDRHELLSKLITF